MCRLRIRRFDFYSGFFLIFTVMKKIVILFISIFSATGFVVAQKTESPYVNGEVLIQLKKDHHIIELLKDFPESFQLRPVKLLVPHMGIWQLQFDTTVTTNQVVKTLLRQNPLVDIVQYNHYVYERATVPNDANFNNQWHHVNTGQTGGTNDADIDSDLAWDITTGGTTVDGDEIVVCLIEGGSAQYAHVDLAANFWQNPHEIPGNSIDDDGNGYTDDIDGWSVSNNNDNHTLSGTHGTRCYGMIAAVGNNSTGVSGAAWNTKVMIVSGFSATESSVIAAYNYPLVMRQQYNSTNGALGAFVVATSASWGIDNADPADYPLWCGFYDTLGAYGILNVGATTNNTVNVDVVGDMPTACSSPYMVSVTRTDHNDAQAGGYGATHIDFGAPGINVYTTTGTTTYTTTTGTSFSCPLTAGVIGLMYSVPCTSMMSLVKSDPQAGADYIRSVLMNAVDPVSSMSGISVTGGRLNSYNAVFELLNSCGPATCNTPNGLTEISVGDFSADISWTDGGTSTGFYYYVRPAGATTWDSVYTTSTSATLAGLDNCTDYEWMVAADCSGTPSSYSSIATFQTTGCCDTVSTLIANVINDSTTMISFGAATGSVNYYFRYKPVNDSVWNYASSSSSPITLTGLSNCTEYVIEVQTQCSIDTTGFALPTYFITPECFTCDTLTYCNSYGNDASLDYIASVKLGEINHASGNDFGYIFNGIYATCTTMINYPIEINPGIGGPPRNRYYKVWMDYNQDGVFDDVTELAYDGGTGVTGGITGNIVVPFSAFSGYTRMRVAMKYVDAGDAAIPDPCMVFNNGEVEDYCVRIVNTVGISAENTSSQFMLYPNPASEKIQLINLPEQAKFVLYDQLGKIVINKTFTTSNAEIDLTRFNKGVYLYSLIADDVIHSGKLIIQ